MKVIAFSENSQILSQVVTKFRDAADVIALTPDPEMIKRFGPKKAIKINGPLMSDAISGSILKTFSEETPDLIIIGSTVTGREVAGIVSAELSTPAISEVNDISLDGGKILTSRFFYGGKSQLKERSSSKIVVVAPGICEASEKPGETEVSEIQLGESALKIVSKTQKNAGSVDIEKAQIIVSVGRGLGKKENLEKVEPFAKAIHAEIGGSRPVCLDYGWLSEDRQVGLSGKKVQPKIYIALGISGQIQHIAGMRNSKVVIAINKDKSAPIFEEADYGIVGDMFEVVGKLKDKVSQ